MEIKMDYKDLERDFLEFKNKNEKDYFNKLSEFLNNFRVKFEAEKILEYTKLGFDNLVAQTKTRQSWVSFLGNSLEKIILIIIKNFCANNHLKVITDKKLKSSNLTVEIDLIKRALLVHFGEYSFLPDADLIIYSNIKNNVKIHCILSIKNSFRERYTETPYWKLKLMQTPLTKDIKVFMITPDNDEEISFIRNKKPRKARIIMEYELDGIYLARELFDSSEKIKNIIELENDILKLLNK
jgi:type II restriction enzyme